MLENPPQVNGFKAIPVRGAQRQVSEKEIKGVSPGFLKEKDISMEDQRIDTFNSQGKTDHIPLTHWGYVGYLAIENR